MGVYLNPKKISKEEWLENKAYASDINHKLPFDEIIKSGMLPVILVDNGPFTAAGIAYDEREYLYFTADDDPRPRKLYLAFINDLLDQVPELERYLDWQLVKKYKDSFWKRLLKKIRR